MICQVASTLLTPKDAAAKLNISLSAVYDLIRSGELAHRRVGAKRGRIRISEEALAAYLVASESAAIPIGQDATSQRRGVQFPRLAKAGYKG